MMKHNIGYGGENPLLEAISLTMFPFYEAMLTGGVPTEIVLGVYTSFLSSAAAERDVPADYFRRTLMQIADLYDTYSKTNQKMRQSGTPVNTKQ